VSPDRESLVAHLREQAAFFVEMTSELSAAAAPEELAPVRDLVFTIRETLATLDVPLATVTNAEWNRAIGTTGP
jgi:hypothetical protein